MGGDFLTQAVPSADVYLLKHLLHDWDDETSVKILRNVRAGMGAGAPILLIEMVIPEQLGAVAAPWMDLNMMVVLGAKERTAAEYGALFARANLTTSRVVRRPAPTQSSKPSPSKGSNAAMLPLSVGPWMAIGHL